MQARQPPSRPQPERSRTDGGLASFVPTPGDFTPERSPLEEIMRRGRAMMREEFRDQGGPAAQPQRTSSAQRRHEPYSGRPGYAAPIGEDEVQGQRNDGRPGTAPMELRMPRFSTITNDSSDRDSMIRDSMIRDSMMSMNDRDSTIMGGFSFGFSGQPSIRDPLKSVQHQFNEGRDSLKPVLTNGEHDDDMPEMRQQPFTPTRAEFNTGRSSVKPIISSVDDESYSPTDETYLPREFESKPPQGVLDRRGVSPGPSPLGMSEYARTPDQPSPRPGQQMSRPPTADRSRQPSPNPNPKPGYVGRQYVPYREANSAQPSPTYPPPSRQSSAENGRFPPPVRTGSNERLVPAGPYGPPSRQNSCESEPKYVPYRQGSTSAAVPVRKSSMSTPMDPNGRPIPPRNAPSPSMLSMNPDVRTLSPAPHSASPAQSPLPSPPNPWTMERSPSAASDNISIYSIGGTRSKAAFNFSRPLSARPSVDLQQRPSIDIPHRQMIDQDEVQTPASINGDAADYTQAGGSAYVYSKFDLPRGRTVERSSFVVDGADADAMSPQGVEMRNQNMSNIRSGSVSATNGSGSPPGPNTRGSPTRGSPSPGPGPSRSASAATPTSLPNPTPPQRQLSSPIGGGLSPRPPGSGLTPRPQPSTERLRPSTSGGPSPHLHVTPTAALDPEEHLRIGLDLHESGSLQESTYHLRCAAHGGHATGMLMYALACRHGWGMRPNQKEGVMWLKKVTQLASSDEASVLKNPTGGNQGEVKQHRARFALSIYELGVSHLNGWGTEMDKGLALNCFEIAGKWGDPDALSEAGFCYANGVGTKKDMKKAAKFYRLAEAKGVNMVGNSWIWKDKYLDDEDRASKALKEGKEAPSVKEKEKKEGGGLFGRKKSLAT
ncbi:Similar to Mitosis inhibitor nif1; acc. no. P87159 [Pyronema omphalodes CBS 100304]|uniref:Similar to Mitosis inhibitor nif1 acc. no. P87159 n=1 Tax=Pyronema omphalodes (strain CBS 100304) TaxID=1076935 RepID=U4L804_PYROM|nr:Similar to Mitosis inhibitor nif1; acc. no. P87159 [Pyronema omphalodes CBS 100304]